MTDLVESQDSDNAFTNRQLVCFTFSVLFVLPLCLLRDMSSLSASSSVSIFFVVFIVFCVGYKGPDEGQENYDEDADYSFIKANNFAGLGVISFAFVCQHSSFLVFNAMKEPTLSNWNSVSKYSVSTAYFLCLLMALFGYLSFLVKLKVTF
eukprot:UN31118